MREDSRAASEQPTLKKIDLTIARLRLLLAEITAREAALEDQRRTCREQRAKLVTFSLYGDSTLDSVLAMLGDVDERLSHIEATARSLARIRDRAAGELESLQLTKSIEEAKVELRELQTRQSSDSPDEVDSEIARLRALINEASERAGKSIHR
jgi:phage shock protein A